MIKLMPVAQLLDKKFLIPFYQRGYRWENTQVDALLDDLFEFANQDNTEGKGKFYCLQPLVVVSNKSMDEKGSDEKSYIVVDGQQRLTTIYLLLLWLYDKYLGKIHGEKLPPQPIFTLEYEKSRNSQTTYIQGKGFEDEKNLTWETNIENFYVKKAWDEIGDWFIRHVLQNPQGKILELLTGNDQKHVAVIWYEIKEDDALKSFLRLNYGKIPLLPSEIVKGTLLQTDCYKGGGEERMKAIANRRANEWERMDIQLNSPALAGMLGLELEKNDLKIGLLLDIVADDLNSEFDKEERFTRKTGLDPNMDLFTYYVINHFLHKKGRPREEAVNEVWNRIQNVYNRINDWYKNRTWYHLIGLYSLLSGHKGIPLIREIYKIIDSAENDKSIFEEKLRAAIGKKLRFKTDQEDEGGKALESSALTYTTNYNAIKNILIAFNVWKSFEEKYDGRLFPFQEIRKVPKWSLEHIHPQSLAEEMDKPFVDLQQGWERFKAANNYWLSQLDEKKAKVVNQIDKALESEKIYRNKGSEKVAKKISELENSLNESLRLKEGDVHKIQNLALLDPDTNSMLQNYGLNEKRQILLDRSADSTWIPPETLKAFSKEYSARQAVTMEKWLYEDREAYLNELQRIYDFFCKAPS